MLVLTRKRNEAIRIGDTITISVVGAEGDRVRLGINAPPDVKVLRRELVGRPARQDRPRRRILIIDDSPEDRETFRRLMGDPTRRPYLFAESETGEEGLARCRSEQPDCILLDYQLPDLDGIEFLDRLRREQDQRTIPVIMVTGRPDPSLADEALRSGAQRFLVKSDLSRDLLRGTICAAIRQVRPN
jgi:carbon storage regulator CsrA